MKYKEYDPKKPDGSHEFGRKARKNMRKEVFVSNQSLHSRRAKAEARAAKLEKEQKNTAP